ncbi:MAG: saccharopine dehydrogenase C-terminal domain-containing protein [Anaerolineae bacterium]
MGFRYVILGAGRQGTAAAYDLARYGDADMILLADAELERAEASAMRVNALVGLRKAEGKALDVRDADRVSELLRNFDVCLSAAPYYFNSVIASAALQARCSMCDLGGNTQVVWEELALDPQAQAVGITIVPDCGVGPGLISNLAVYAMEQLDTPQEVLIYDGGLPQNPRPPFNYTLFFNIAGLTNEYYGNALYLVDGKATPTPCWDEREYELIDIPQLGQLEAFVTSGGLSTMITTFGGKLKTLKNKTMRYPGHFQFMKGLADLGMLELEPVQVGDQRIVPRHVLHALLGPRITPRPGDRDLMAIHIVARGEKEGKPAQVTLDLLDRYNETTGFSAMERTTGFHLAIVAAMIAHGKTPHGAVPLERAVSARRIVEALDQRGMQVEVKVS